MVFVFLVKVVAKGDSAPVACFADLKVPTGCALRPPIRGTSN